MKTLTPRSTTRTTQTTNTATASDRRCDEAQAVLRDMAFVLSLTRRVKAEVLREQDAAAVCKA